MFEKENYVFSIGREKIHKNEMFIVYANHKIIFKKNSLLI